MFLIVPTKGSLFSNGFYFFYHFFYFFKYANLLKKKTTQISFFFKKINYFKLYFLTAFRLLKSRELKRLQLSRSKAERLCSLDANAFFKGGSCNQHLNFFRANLYLFSTSGVFSTFNPRQGVFFFSKHGKNSTFSPRKPRKNLFFRSVSTFI